MTSRSGICINLLMCWQKVCTATPSMHLPSGDIGVLLLLKLKGENQPVYLVDVVQHLVRTSCVMVEAKTYGSPGEEYRVWGYGCMVATQRPRTSSQLCMSDSATGAGRRVTLTPNTNDNHTKRLRRRCSYVANTQLSLVTQAQSKANCSSLGLKIAFELP